MVVPQSAESKTRQILAQNMRVLRAHEDLSQEGLGFASGLHRTFIGGIERRQRNVSIDNITKIAGALGIEVWRLLKKDGAIVAGVSDEPRNAGSRPRDGKRTPVRGRSRIES